MIFTNYDFFGMDNFNENMNCVNSIYFVQLQSSIVDQLSIRANTTGIVYSSTKEIWNYDEILLADFINSLEAGNLMNSGVPITSLLFMKKKTTDLVWNTIILIPFLTTQSVYQFNDNYVASNVSYDYALVPVSVGSVQGQWIIKTIIPTWDGTFLFDDSYNYRFYYNLKWDNIQNNQIMGKYEPIGATKPIAVFSSMDYDSGKITNTLLSDNSLNRLGTAPNGIDLYAERTLMNSVKAFIKNKKAKMLKDGQGKYMCVVTSNFIETPNNNVAGAIGDASFNFMEIADAISSLASVNLGNIIQS